MSGDRKGIWMPIEIWNLEDINLIQKHFLVEIASLANDNGCYASNTHFANFFGLSRNRCSEIIKKLEELGYISTSYETRKNSKEIEKRIITLGGRFSDNVVGLSTDPIRFIDRGYSENTEGINTSNINTFINNNIVELVDYLNIKTGSKYRSNSKETIKIISKAFDDKYSLDDLKKIVDNMTSAWTGTDYEPYLRPSTLFRSSNLEKYLNWKVTKKDEVKKDENSKWFAEPI